MDASELASAIDRNYAAAFRMVARHSGEPAAGWKAFGDVTAVATGLSSAYYNPVLALAPGIAAADIEAALTWLGARGVTPSVHVRTDLLDDRIAGLLAERGLACDEGTPAMALTPIPDAPSLPPELRIEAIVPETLGAWHRTFARVFRDESDESLARVRAAFPGTLLDDPDSRLLAGNLGDELAVTGWAVRSDEIVGVYAVGTDVSVRHRGYGSAMTWACLAAGRAWGCRIATLQASDTGVGVYERIGFRTLSSYAEYMPVGPAPEEPSPT